MNDRNAVDIIRRLLEAKQISLIFTQDGKEYLTHEQLQHEIVSLVKDEGNGRMALLDMPHHLGVDYDVVLQKVQHLVTEGAGQLINDFFVTPAYLTRMVEEVHDLVQSKGIVEWVDLADKFNLPLSFIKAEITLRKDSLPPDTELQTSSLVSSTFSMRLMCKVRGFLRGLSRPATI